MNRPTWRWAIFCVALEAHRVLGYRWLADLWAWCILPTWLASEQEVAAHEASAGNRKAPW